MTSKIVLIDSNSIIKLFLPPKDSIKKAYTKIADI